MVTPTEITGYLDVRWFDSLAGLGSWVLNIVLGLLLFGALYVGFRVMEHKRKVFYWEIYGNGEKTIDGTDELQLGVPKRARLADIKHKGIKKSSLMIGMNFFTTKKMQPIPYAYRYPEGIYMLRLDKDIFQPIERPEISKEGFVNIKIPEPDMDLWQQSAEETVRRRTQDESMMKTQMYMTVGIILGAFVLAGVIIWLSMSFAGNSLNSALDKVNPIVDGLSKLTGSGQAPG